jgi:hypothetical protein
MVLALQESRSLTDGPTADGKASITSVLGQYLQEYKQLDSNVDNITWFIDLLANGPDPDSNE